MIVERVLDKQDVMSAVWIKLRRHIEQRIESLRLKNDANLTELETARLRGQIAELKNLAALDDPVPPMESDAAE